MQSMFSGVENWQVSSARKFLYSSAILFFTVAAAFLLVPDFRGSIESLGEKSAISAGALLLLLAFPIGYTINAVSYFLLSTPISWLERPMFWLARSGVTRTSESFDVPEIASLFQLEKWSDLLSLSKLVMAFRQVPAFARVNWQQRAALSGFVRNVTLLALVVLVASPLASQPVVGLACLALAVFLLGLFLVAAIEIYIKVELLRAVRDLDDVIYFGEPIRTKDKYDGRILLVAKLHRLDRFIRSEGFRDDS
jgi:hypothetical protein